MVTEQDLTPVEQQLVALALQKKQQAESQLAVLHRQAQQQFALDTAEVAKAHGATNAAQYDVRPDGTQVFIRWDAPDIHPSDPADPLS